LILQEAHYEFGLVYNFLSPVQEPEEDTCTAVIPLLFIMDPLKIERPLRVFLLTMHCHIYC
jgi:hypothetical protein